MTGEEYGVLTEGPDEEDANFIDLPAMGADPDKPDIFVHLDYMLGTSYDAELSPEALETVVEAFANAPYESPTESVGINLHIDHGPSSVLDYSTNPDTLWGSLSRAGEIDPIEEAYNQGPFDILANVLGDFDGSQNYIWDEFDALQAARFLPTGRSPIFHYAIVWQYYGSIAHDSGGIAYQGLPDFILTFGTFEPEGGNADQQAGTLMHELGHNLGLQHGGDDDINYKPNYLSVMNYSFQNIGVIQDTGSSYEPGFYDFSRAPLDSLDEAELYESVGLGASASGYGTIFFCGFDPKAVNYDASDPIDWNCNQTLDDPVQSSINNNTEDDEVLDGHDDWSAVTFGSGRIGGPGGGFSSDILESQPHLAVQEVGFEELRELGLSDRETFLRKIAEKR